MKNNVVIFFISDVKRKRERKRKRKRKIKSKRKRKKEDGGRIRRRGKAGGNL